MKLFAKINKIYSYTKKMSFSKPSILTISSLIFILGFLFLISSNPKLFDQKYENQDQCFMMFFMTGVSATIVYHLVSSIYR